MNLRKLDLNLLLVFDTVYKTRSNTKAAEQLGLTQSAVSNALKRLREHLDDPLFQRDGADFVPTPEADRLSPVIREALNSLERSISSGREFDPQSNDRIFSFLMPDSMELLIAAELINNISQHNWNIKFRTQPYFAADVQNSILEKKFDFALLPNSIVHGSINSAYLMDEDGCIITRRDNPKYLNHTSFSLKDMAEAELIAIDEEIRRHTHIEQEIKSKGISRNHVCIVPRLWSVPHLVSQTDGVGAIPRTMAENLADTLKLKIYDLPLERPVHHWHMVWHEDFEHDSGHIWMRNQIQKIIRQKNTSKRK